MTDASRRAEDADIFTPRGLVLEVDDLHVSFRGRRRLAPRVRAVNGVSFSIGSHETLGLVGESGSGKSTVGRALMRLVEFDSGTVRLLGRDLATMGRSELRQARRDVQMVFQDPYSSMNPAMVVADIIGEPLEVQAGIRGTERNKRVAELLEQVGLSQRHVDRYPYEFSGGQRQRIAIARAIANRPKLVVCDEAVSALDVSTQNQIINLLEDLQSELDISFLFIAHDLAVVRHIAGRTAVMYLGKIVEEGPSARIFEQPAHPYSLGLLSAVPIPNPRRQRGRARVVLAGEPPDPSNPPPGCPFITRCPWAMDVCHAEMPGPTPVDGGGSVACHLQTSGLTLAGRPLKDVPVPA
ncbi:MAG: oligopeptide/dipeptide ABC transporter ATP-binding protein [Ilumatobacteraceae bacterium]